MAQSTEAVTTAMLKMALDGAALRQQAIAANIANATTPGYRPVHVAFEEQLQLAQQRLEAGDAAERVASELAPSIERDAEAHALVAVDLQAAQLAENVVHYQALIKGWNKRMAILSAALNEGKR
jgi:flagellar basal-body rod protein FlgB